MKITLYRDYPEEGWNSMDVYADNLLRSLRSYYPHDIVRDFVALPTLSRLFSKQKRKIRYFFRYVINPLFAPFYQRDVNIVVDQAQAHLLLVLNPKKTIVTCHDTIVPFWQEKHAHTFSLWTKIKFRVKHWRMRCLRRAAVILCVSQATKNRLIADLAIPTQKIVVIPEGVAPLFQPITNRGVLDAVCTQYHLPKTFFLHVGSNEKHKNIEYIFTLVSKIKHICFVKVGHPFTPTQQVCIKKLHIEKRVFHIGSLPTSDLPAVYSLAFCLVQPSFIEGFGLTVLEAMACGCPVFVSKDAALQALAGGAGISLTLSASRDIPYIQKILRDKTNLEQNKHMGILQAKKFTWEKTARATRVLCTTITSIS